MNRGFVAVFVTVSAALGFVAGALWSSHGGESRDARVVAVAWGDSKYGHAFYGAVVSVDNERGAGAVRAVVHIGRGSSYIRDLGELGRVASVEEAVQRFGRVEFRDDGLHLGDYFLAREELEKHR